MYYAKNFIKLLTKEEEKRIKNLLSIILENEIKNIEAPLRKIKLNTLAWIIKQAKIPYEKITADAFLLCTDYEDFKKYLSL